jgi:hypothetical protein
MKSKLLSVFLLLPSLAFAQELYEIRTNAKTRWSSFENPGATAGAGGKENAGAKGHAFDVIQPRGSKLY